MAYYRVYFRYVAEYLRIRPGHWKRLFASDSFPMPDGYRVRPNGEKEYYWFEDTLDRWRRR